MDATVDRLENAATRIRTPCVGRIAGPDPHDLSIARRHGHGADRRDASGVEHRVPRNATVDCFPKAAASDRGPDCIEMLMEWRIRHRNRCHPCAWPEGSDVAEWE